MFETAKWNAYEVSFEGPSEGNPFLEVTISATFSIGNRRISVPGFYDGSGIYRVRFMPEVEGLWEFTTTSNSAALDGKSGSFICTPPTPGSHGPVRVANRHHFAYADGTAYFPFGTTCYAWTHQPLEMQEQTLETLKKTKFNKIRMCVFPKDYKYSVNEPLFDMYSRNENGTLDFNCPNPIAFQHFEKQVVALMELGIEADVIVFHPYDRWGYSGMTEDQDNQYISYLAARLSGFRNVWWSLANEYDFLIDTKPMASWDRYFQIIEQSDPSRHLKSIHNGNRQMNYNHRKPWVDHVCVQNEEVQRTADWREQYGKPLVNDELQYEGNLRHQWGSINAKELVHRFWATVMRGGYAGHSETYSHPEDLLWWAKGGELYGESWKRIGFLRDLIEADVVNGLHPVGENSEWTSGRIAAAEDGRVRYIYFGEHQPVEWSLGLPQKDGNYQLDVIDTWEMTVTPAERIAAPENHPSRHGSLIKGLKPDAAFGVALPGKPYLALRIREV